MANVADAGKRLKLTVFLIKPGYPDVHDFMNYGGLSTVSIQSGRHKGTLAFKGGFRSTPSWVSLFEGVTGFDANKMQDITATPDPNAYTICFAIMSKEVGPLELPFFSKVSMRYAVKTLRRMGFKSTTLKIER